MAVFAYAQTVVFTRDKHYANDDVSEICHYANFGRNPGVTSNYECNVLYCKKIDDGLGS